MAVQATVSTTIRSGVQILTSAAFFASQPPRIPFEIAMADVIHLEDGGTDPVALDDSAYTVPFMNRFGYNVHSDQLLREILNRQAAAQRFRPFDPNLSNLDVFAHFRAVLLTDPNRVVIIDCLPRSTAVGSLETSADAPAQAA